MSLFHPKVWVIGLVFLNLSCSERAEFISNEKGLFINDQSAKIADLDNLKWTVGLARKTISKGFRVEVQLPRLTDDAAMELYHKGISSWIIQVRKRKTSGLTSTLGSMYVPFVRINRRDSSNVRPATIKSIFFQVNYAAVSPAKRFESFQCPAFGHNKYLNDFRIQEATNKLDLFYVSSNQRVRRKPTLLQITPIEFNGGMSLRGNYFIDIALYDPKSQTTYSNFVTLKERIEILSEEEKYLKGCSTFRIPDRPDPSKKKFKFGN